MVEKRLTGFIILALLALSPIFTIVDVFNTLRGDMTKLFTTETPVYIKLLKDIGFLTIIAASFFASPAQVRTRRLALASPLAIATAILFILSCRTDPVRAMAGLRWLLPAFAAIFLVGDVDDRLMTKIAKTISVIFIIHFAIQLYEQTIRNMITQICSQGTKPVWPGLLGRYSLFLTFGKGLYGIRACGIFMQPATAGFFAVVTGFSAYFYMKKSILRTATLVLIPLSIHLCGSMAAILGYLGAIFLILLMGKRLNGFSTVLFILLIVITVFALPVLTGRGDLLESPFLRLSTFTDRLKSMEIVSSRFGEGTNTMALILERSGRPQSLYSKSIMDSMINGILVNTGLLGLFAAGAAYLYWLAKVLKSGRQDAVIFTLIYSIFAVINSITEAFPMNLLLAVGLAYFAPVILPRPKTA